MKNQIDRTLIFIYSLVQFANTYNSISDPINIQFVYLSIVTLATSLYLMLNGETLLNWKTLAIGGILYQTLFILLAIISVSNAFNKTESFVALSRYLQLFLFFFNINILFKRCEFKLKDLSLIFIFLVLGDLALFIPNLFVSYDFNTPPIGTRNLMGFAANQNILAFSILTRLYIIIYLYLTTRKKSLFYSSIVVLSLSVYMILTTGSRGGLLALLFTFSILFLLIILFSKKNIKRMIVISFVFLGTFISHELINVNHSENNFQNITSFTLEGRSSTNERLQWYGDAINGIKDKPLFGHGIGNWKILAEKYAGDYIQNYRVPYHAHNDFLHLSAEIGLLGGLAYLLFFIYFLVQCFKKIKNNNDKIEPILIGLAVTVFLIDSLINFPRARAISMANIFLIGGLLTYPKFSMTSKKQYSFIIVYCATAIILLFSLYRVYDVNSKVLPLKGVISNQINFDKIDLGEIDKISNEFPSLDAQTFPIISKKGIVYWKKGKVEEGKKMILSGLNANPYLGFIEANLSQIYLEEGKIDSAYYMAKKAIMVSPNNTRHVNILQASLIARKDTVGLNKVFEKNQHYKRQETWQNHLSGISKLKYKEGFNYHDKRISKEALSMFPDNSFIREAHKVIHMGFENVIISNNFIGIASNAFVKKDYEKAEEYFKKAKNLVPIEASNYLNLAQIYALTGEVEKSINELNLIEENKIQINDGKREFLMGLNMVSLDKTNESCVYLKKSYNKGYERTKVLSILKKLRCL
jgi:putative inorganic carbon (HCO3(-)) transporter